MTVITKLRERMYWIHRMLITPPQENKLNHFQKRMLEEEYEEIELKVKDSEGVGS